MISAFCSSEAKGIFKTNTLLETMLMRFYDVMSSSTIYLLFSILRRQKCFNKIFLRIFPKRITCFFAFIERYHFNVSFSTSIHMFTKSNVLIMKMFDLFFVNTYSYTYINEGVSTILFYWNNIQSINFIWLLLFFFLSIYSRSSNLIAKY